ncbi:hypothetical protein J1N35_043238 [Gossypium stocksii]|uniref:NAC domain-containing protein n=1 Tax=Gossypium stocksii TaxID=47602 RepID=A0A9D3U6Y5_9ROSI|nr:hypothetical protein J1N35_043238 [Gossypium stocksii]
MSQLQILLGFRFLPTKEEILCDYLKPIIKGDPIPSGVLKARHIYGANREPWNIFDQDSPESFWVFTKEKEQIKNRKNRGRWMLAPTVCQRSEEQGRRRNQEAVGSSDLVICEIKNKDVAIVSSDYEESEGEIKKNKKRKLMKVPSDSTNDFATMPVGNQTFDYMAPESRSRRLLTLLCQQPNPWTWAGVGGNLGVPDYMT